MSYVGNLNRPKKSEIVSHLGPDYFGITVEQLEDEIQIYIDEERQNDNLFISDIEEAILNGRILEHYEDTGRGESSLVAGFADNGKPVHVICSEGRDWLVIITVSIPTPPKFKTPFARG